jgi:hypothetical protein
MCVHDRCSTKLYFLKKRLQQAYVTSVPLHEVAWKISNAFVTSVYVGSLFANGIDTNSWQFAMKIYSKNISFCSFLLTCFTLKTNNGDMFTGIINSKGMCFQKNSKGMDRGGLDRAVAGWWRRFHSVYV